MSNLARKRQPGKSDCFHVTTIIDGEVKSQKWNSGDSLNLPQPVGGKIEYSEGYLVHQSPDGTETMFALETKSHVEIPVEGYQEGKVIVDRLSWGGSDFRTEGSIGHVTSFLTMMVVSGRHRMGTSVQSLNKKTNLTDD